MSAIGAGGIAALLPYVQPAGFGPTLARALDTADVDADELRDRAAEAAGVPTPELVKLRRVTWGSVVQVALLALAVSAVAGWATGLDYAALAERIGEASWGWIVFAFVLAQAPRVTQAISTLGSVPARIPFLPVYAMQLATGYLNLALPSGFARMAINIRFFQRHGVPPATAVTSGAIDSFVSTVAQALMLGALLLFSESGLDFGLETPSGPPTRALAVVVGLGLVGVAVVWTVRRLRTAIVERVRRWWPDVRATLVSLRAGNKLGLLLGGSLATEIIFAVTLGVFVERVRLRRRPRRPAARQHLGVAALDVRPGPRRHRRDGVRPDRRAHGRRRARGGGARRRRPLPHRDLLSPAGVGLLRDALAAAQRHL